MLAAHDLQREMAELDFLRGRAQDDTRVRILQSEADRAEQRERQFTKLASRRDEEEARKQERRRKDQEKARQVFQAEKEKQDRQVKDAATAAAKEAEAALDAVQTETKKIIDDTMKLSAGLRPTSAADVVIPADSKSGAKTDAMAVVEAHERKVKEKQAAKKKKKALKKKHRTQMANKLKAIQADPQLKAIYFSPLAHAHRLLRQLHGARKKTDQQLTMLVARFQAAAADQQSEEQAIAEEKVAVENARNEVQQLLNEQASVKDQVTGLTQELSFTAAKVAAAHADVTTAVSPGAKMEAVAPSNAPWPRRKRRKCVPTVLRCNSRRLALMLSMLVPSCRAARTSSVNWSVGFVRITSSAC